MAIPSLSHSEDEQFDAQVVEGFRGVPWDPEGLLATGAVDTLPRKPQTPASESSEEESSDESGSEYSEDGPDWIEGWDPPHKHVYYFNHVTEVTTWARPRDAEVRPMSAKDAARRREDLLNK